MCVCNWLWAFTLLYRHVQEYSSKPNQPKLSKAMQSQAKVGQSESKSKGNSQRQSRSKAYAKAKATAKAQARATHPICRSTRISPAMHCTYGVDRRWTPSSSFTKEPSKKRSGTWLRRAPTRPRRGKTMTEMGGVRGRAATRAIE